MKLVTVNRSSFCLQWFDCRDVQQQQQQVYLSCAAPTARMRHHRTALLPVLHTTEHQHTTTSQHITFIIYSTNTVIFMRANITIY